jgi:hypothetical protein
MNSTRPIAAVLFLFAAACAAPATEAGALSYDARVAASAAPARGMVRVTFPDPDPGVPAYARLGIAFNQILSDGEWLAVPMLRDPACIPAEFDLLGFFDPPGPGGPGAFACTLNLHGWYLTEADAPQGTFPLRVHSSGDAVPFWFVRWAEFEPLLASGTVRIGELAALPSLVRGSATRFEEVLHPRPDEHRVVIDARGRLENGQPFRFHLTSVGDRIVAIRISFR